MAAARRWARQQPDVTHVAETHVRRAVSSSASAMAANTTALSPIAASSTAASSMVVGAVDDEYERHADALAAQVVSRLGGLGERDADAAAPGGGSQTRAATHPPVAAVRRRARGDAESAVGPAGGVLDVSMAGAIERARGGGRPLSAGVRAGMEAGFGADFSGVRLHSGGESDRLNASLGAQAFTVGSDVFVHSSSPRFDSAEGSHLLAHELAHTLQQGSTSGPAPHGGLGATPIESVQRFPATAMTTRVAWSAESPTVTRPGGGASGGVYILKSKTGPIDTVVVKPIFGENGMGLQESAEQLVAGDRILNRVLGIDTPESRIVGRGTREFTELATLCMPKQPGPPPPDLRLTYPWSPLSDAQAFVVMSKVPDGKSVASMAEEACKSGDVTSLMTAVFAPRFMYQLGVLVIGDLLVGNMDRIGFGQANLGNIMAQITEGGRPNLVAIDTTVALPKAFGPKNFSEDGHMASHMADDSVRKKLDRGPRPVFDIFIEAVLGATRGVESNGWVKTDDNTASTALTQQLAAVKDKLFASFSEGWSTALVQVRLLAMHLRSGGKMGFGELESRNVTREGLTTTATYIGGRASGESHGDAMAEASANNIVNYLEAASLADFLPDTSSLLPPTFTKPADQALSAEFVGAPSLPTAKRIQDLIPKKRSAPRPLPHVELASIASAIFAAHGEIDSAVGPTKVRGSRGKVVPRNRSLLGHAVVDATATVAGSSRDLLAFAHVEKTLEAAVGGIPGAKFTPSQATRVKSILSTGENVIQSIDANLARYASSITVARKAASKMRNYDGAESLARIANIAIKTISDFRTQGGTAIADLDLAEVVKKLG